MGDVIERVLVKHQPFSIFPGRNHFRTRGAFHYVNDSGNFGQKSNGKIHFGSFRPEYSGSPLVVVHFFRLEHSDRNSPFHFWTNRFFALIREFGGGIKRGMSHSYWLALFTRKLMPFHFPRVFPLTSDRSVWHNESTLGQLVQILV